MNMSDFILCDRNNVSYLDIRKAMVKGLRTADEMKEAINVCAECAGCKTSLELTLSTVCRCRVVPLKAVEDAVKSGANTTEKVGQATKAGTSPTCGKCKILIDSIIVDLCGCDA